MLRDVIATQKKHTQRFDVQSATLEETRDEIAKINGTLELHGKVLSAIIDILSKDDTD